MRSTVPISLRPAGDADEPFLRELYASTRVDELTVLPAELGARFANSQYDLQRAHYLNHYPGAAWAVIVHGEQPIGRLIVDRTIDPWLLVDIAIVPEWRNQGIGTTLIEQLKSEATAAESRLVLSVRVDNSRALRLYQRLGFVTRSSNSAYIELLH